MTHIYSRASLFAYYADAISRHKDTAERLRAPVSKKFMEILNSLPNRELRTALDLGYGAGNYVLELARAGFDVLAVDQIPSVSLKERVCSAGDWANRIDILEEAIEDVVLDRRYDLVIAKDVLHYLKKTAVDALLQRVIASSNPGCVHYFEVFTDVCRTTSSGERVCIEGEADYTVAEFRRMIASVYTGWDVEVSTEAYGERDLRTTQERDYFEAIKVRVVAKLPRAGLE